MLTYIGIVHQEDRSAYGIHFPDVPGCFSAADNLNDLLDCAKEALSLHLEGESPPVSRDIGTLANDPEVQRELQAGGMLMAVPLIHLTGRTVRANLTLDAGLLAALDAEARARKMSRSALVADMARREIG